VTAAGGLARLRGFLDENAVEYTVVSHSAALTGQHRAEMLDLPGARVAKMVMARTGGGMVMVVLAAPQDLVLSRLAKAVGGEVSLAHEEEFTPLFPDCDAGAMPPFGNLYGVRVYVDERLAAQPTVAVPAGTYTESITLRFADFGHLVNPVLGVFGDDG
jgi:Ala-tRNA(Pro) deacylase